MILIIMISEEKWYQRSAIITLFSGAICDRDAFLGSGHYIFINTWWRDIFPNNYVSKILHAGEHTMFV